MTSAAETSVQNVLEDSILLASEAYVREAAEAFPLGVILPTYNRVEVLLTCLQHLERQQWKRFETVVVDDGSTDATFREMEKYVRATPLRLRYVRQRNTGPAGARNRAIAMLRSPVCLMIGDDILATPGMVGEHAAFHERRPELNAAGLGLTRWSRTGQTVTRFMRWLDEGGLQFSYGDLLAGKKPGWEHFYTSNLSLKTQLLRDEPFDPSFPGAAMEDLELGYRISRRHGLELVLLPQALAYHVHPTTFAQAARRMRGVGAAAYLFRQRWPEAHPASGPPSAAARRVRRALRSAPWLLQFATAIAGLISRFAAPDRLLRLVLLQHFGEGYNERERAAERIQPAAGGVPGARTPGPAPPAAGAHPRSAP